MFTETELILPIIPQISFTINYSTYVLREKSGNETRIARRYFPSYEIDLGDMVLSESELVSLKTFFEARKGTYEGFRFKMLLDYQATETLNILGTNITNQGVLLGSGTDYQLMKKYTVGTVNSYRTITKPRAGTISIFEDGLQLSSGFSLDLNSGKVTFDTAPSGVLTWSGEFDTPVRFNQDQIDARQVANDGIRPFYNVSPIKLTSLFVDNINPYTTADVTDTTESLVLDTITNIESGTEFRSQVKTVSSGSEKRKDYFTQGRDVGSSDRYVLSQVELDYLLAFFMVMKGRLLGFSVDGSRFRFAQDELKPTIETAHRLNDNSLRIYYQVPQLQLKEIDA